MHFGINPEESDQSFAKKACFAGDLRDSNLLKIFELSTIYQNHYYFACNNLRIAVISMPSASSVTPEAWPDS